MTQEFIKRLQDVTTGSHFWESYLTELSPEAASFSVHLAVLVEPYLRSVLEGRKTVESRFSAKRIPPFNCVHKGDVILLKRSSGPIVGICLVQSSWFYRLDTRTWNGIRKRFTEALCAEDPSFWEARCGASYATLMRIARVQQLTPIDFQKRDRRGWVVLHPRALQAELPGSTLVI